MSGAGACAKVGAIMLGCFGWSIGCSRLGLGLGNDVGCSGWLVRRC